MPLVDRLSAQRWWPCPRNMKHLIRPTVDHPGASKSSSYYVRNSVERKLEPTACAVGSVRVGAQRSLLPAYALHDELSCVTRAFNWAKSPPLQDFRRKSRGVDVAIFVQRRSKAKPPTGRLLHFPLPGLGVLRSACSVMLRDKW